MLPQTIWKRLDAWDHRQALRIARNRPPWLTRFLRFVSNSGTVPGWTLIIALVYLSGLASISAVQSMALASAFGLFGSQIAKRMIQRPRPFAQKSHPQPLARQPRDPSFPSGHATSALATAVGLSLEEPSFAAFIIPWGLLIGWSRFYLGVHHLSDIIAGTIFGTALGYLAATII